jgi:alpha-1,2-mannosyltransferase
VSESTVSGTIASPGSGGERSDTPPAARGFRNVSLTPVTLVIIAGTLLALALRLYQLTRPGFLLSVTEYDDGPYFGSALRLVNGSLPYRDFLLVQPPGITLLMVPAALLGKLTGTAGAMAAGRILTALAGAAAVALAGLLVRHRGVLAAVIVCGILAVYPDSVQAAHTILVEPWLVLFCLLGAVAVFDGDRLTTSWRRLAWGGAAFGFAGTVEIWAIVPVIVIAVLALRWPRRLCIYVAGVAVGFLVPVLPFVALAPHQFYTGVITAQIGDRADAGRVSVWARLHEMTGLSDLAHPSHLLITLVMIFVAGASLGCLAVACLLSRRLPSALEVFAVATAALVVASFMWPKQFHYHFGAFLAPFLALAIGLPVARLATGIRPAADGTRTAPPALAQLGAAVAGLAIITMALIQAGWESVQPPHVPGNRVTAAQRLIPAGACVVTDEVSFTILADRFNSDVPGCPLLVDSIGTDYGLSHGLEPATGAARYPALVAVWQSSFRHAQYVWLSGRSHHRLPWTPQLMAYFTAHFTPILSYGKGGVLYRRNGL